MLDFLKHSVICAFLLFVLSNNCQAQIDHWETVIYNDDFWNYRLGFSEPASNWMQVEYDDSNWSTSMGGFGYGDNDDNTLIPTVISIYIRKKFELVDTSVIRTALLHADYDDAFVAYINGVEIARGNFGLPGNAPNFDATPQTDHEAVLYQGGIPESYPINAETFDEIFVEGENTLAIQIHNISTSSSDFSSNFFLSLGITDNSMNYGAPPNWFFSPAFQSNLPLLKLNTFGQNIEDDPRIVANLQVIDNGPGALNSSNDFPTDYDGRISIEVRGNSSQLYEKKNYGFETQDEIGENNNVSLLGMPEENDWILHGPFSDKSLIRNALTFNIGRSMMPYASRTKFCELLINDNYEGIYLLMEKIKRDSARVDIAKLRPEDIEGDELTGGYIFRLDWANENSSFDGWSSPLGNPAPYYSYYSPSAQNLLPVQKNYISSWMTDFETAMQQQNFAFTFENYIDVESFIDYFLINEFTKQIDAYKLSFYMHKKKDSNGGKLHMGPIWDFNLGYSNFDFACNPNPEGWIYPCTSRVFWLEKILSVPSVRNKMNCRWQHLRQDILDVDMLMGTIDSLIQELGPAVNRNFDRFNVLGQYIWPNFFIGSDHEEEIDFLKQWILLRLNWMDNNIYGDPNFDCDALVSTEETMKESYIKAYPNPFDQFISFTGPGLKKKDAELCIHDVFGTQISCYHSNELIELDLSTINTGMYFFSYKEKGVLIQTGKIVKK